MSLLIFLGVAVAGGLGAIARFLVDSLIRSRRYTEVLWATMAINISGSLAMGFVVGVSATQLMSNDVALVISTGFLGGYTTFSAASYETVQLIRQRRYGMSLVVGVGTLLLTVGAVGLGLWLASLL